MRNFNKKQKQITKFYLSTYSYKTSLLKISFHYRFCSYILPSLFHKSPTMKFLQAILEKNILHCKFLTQCAKDFYKVANLVAFKVPMRS